MFLKKALILLLTVVATCEASGQTQWYKFPNRRVAVKSIEHVSTTAFQDATNGATFKTAQLDIYQGTTNTGTLLHTLIQPFPAISSTSTEHTIKTSGGKVSLNYFFFDSFIDANVDTYVQATFTDSAGVKYVGGGTAKYSFTGDKDFTVSFTSSASPAVTTSFKIGYKVFDTSYTAQPSKQAIAERIMEAAKDSCVMNLFNQYLFCKLNGVENKVDEYFANWKDLIWVLTLSIKKAIWFKNFKKDSDWKYIILFTHLDLIAKFLYVNPFYKFKSFFTM